MGKEVDLMFTVTVGMPFWVLGSYELFIIDFFIPVVCIRNCRVTCTIKGSGWSSGAVRASKLKWNSEWYQPGII